MTLASSSPSEWSIISSRPGFEIDEAGQTLKRKSPAPLHRTPVE